MYLCHELEKRSSQLTGTSILSLFSFLAIYMLLKPFILPIFVISPSIVLFVNIAVLCFLFVVHIFIADFILISHLISKQLYKHLFIIFINFCYKETHMPLNFCQHYHYIDIIRTLSIFIYYLIN